jgi:hypothetical protein
LKEDLVEKHLVRRCGRLGVWAVKGETLGKGWPDRLLLAWPGRIAWVELKRPGIRKGRRRQELIRAALVKLGFTAVLCSTKEQVDEFLDKWGPYALPPGGSLDLPD